jgi:hypothetical protein
MSKKQSKGLGDSPKGWENPAAYLKDGTKRQAGPAVIINSHGGGGDTKVGGKKANSRLDKKARGGKVAKLQKGGAIHKITPSKHKPHVSVNVINVTRRPQGRRHGLAMPPPIGALKPPGMGPPGLGVPPGMGLPGLRPPGMKRGGRNAVN